MKRVDDFRLRFGTREYVPIMIGGMGVDISASALALCRIILGVALSTHIAAFLASGAAHFVLDGDGAWQHSGHNPKLVAAHRRQAVGWRPVR